MPNISIPENDEKISEYIPALFPDDEKDRLAALHSLGILDTPPDKDLDRITRLARIIFGCRVALVSLIDDDRQWFKSASGTTLTETPRSVSFCGYTIFADEAFIVKDASTHPVFARNPLVIGAPHIRFYAGAPLNTRKGSKIGSLCVIDMKPHLDWSPIKSRLLEDLGALVSTIILHRRAVKESDSLRDENQRLRRKLAYSAELDQLTGVQHRLSLEPSVDAAIIKAGESDGYAALAFLNIDRFASINASLGFPTGDEILQTVAKRFTHSVRGSDVVIRMGDDRFAIVFSGLKGKDGLDRPLRAIRETMCQPIQINSVTIALTVSIGVSIFPTSGENCQQMIEFANAALDKAKREGGNCWVIAEPDNFTCVNPQF